MVGVAFRTLLGEGGPLGFLGLDGTPVAIICGLVFFNVAVVVRAVAHNAASFLADRPRVARVLPELVRRDDGTLVLRTVLP